MYGIFVSSLVGTSVIFIATLIFSFLFYKSIDLPRNLHMFLSICIVIGSFVSGYISSFKCKFKGFISGLLSSFVLSLTITVSLLFFSNGHIINKAGFLYILIIIFSVLGGILGANTKRRKWGKKLCLKLLKLKSNIQRAN